MSHQNTVPESTAKAHDVEQIRKHLGDEFSSRLHYFASIESTNAWLQGEIGAPSGTVCLTDFQSRGRGRRGRSWLAPPGSSIMFSVLNKFTRVDLSGLSLALGARLAQTLILNGAERVGLKWPNDLIIGDQKMGGILVEQSSAGTIMGAGINFRIPEEFMDNQIQWTDISTHYPAMDRDWLAASLIEATLNCLRDFENSGFTDFIRDWEGLHQYDSREVNVLTGSVRRTGTVIGLAADGALKIQIDGRIENVYAADVSIRLAQGESENGV
ncbi:MAG: biotin--[acetyl-CoA-carboxylase] ligase [Pseudomonadota bacterium]